jgi:hypothetical protein
MVLKSRLGITTLLMASVLSACLDDNSSSSSDGKLVVVGSDKSTTTAASKYAAKGIGGTPDFLALEMFGVYVSASADCSNPVAVQTTEDPVYEDLTASPNLFSGNLAPGNYECVIFDIHDVIVFSPDAAAETMHGADCTDNTLYDFDILRENDNESWYSINAGADVAGTGTIDTPRADRVALIMTTDPAAQTLGHENQTLTMLNPLVITKGETVTAEFVVDFTDQITVATAEIGSFHCWVEAPVIDFTY